MAGPYLPLDRAAAVLGDLLAAPVSPGSISTWRAVAGDRLAPFLSAVRTGLRAAAVVHFDATGLRVAGQLGWTHSASTATLSLVTAHQRRGVAALDDADVLAGMTGIAGQDCCKPYGHSPLVHGVCNAHIRRELAGVAETNRQRWAERMAELLVAAKQRVDAAQERGEPALSVPALTELRARYQQLLDDGYAVNPILRRRVRCKRSAAGNLLERLGRHREQVLRFTTDFRVPFDNNQAERDIRLVKLRQKVSGCLRSWDGARLFAALRRYVSTAIKQGQSVLGALRMLHQGRAWLPATE